MASTRGLSLLAGILLTALLAFQSRGVGQPHQPQSSVAPQIANAPQSANPSSRPSSQPVDPVDFVRDVQPILAQSCHDCHGESRQRGALRLDLRSAAFAGGNSGPAIIPGNSAGSPLLIRVRGQGDQDQMPLKKPPLPDHQIALLARWIDQGAAWPDSASNQDAPIRKHWAYEKPLMPVVPTVRQTEWVRNPIDAFILHPIELAGMSPSPPAPRTTLLRRVYLDLIGVPPTIAQTDSFLADTRPDAYERVVDALLASPHFGERWARQWLDLARYADSNGYERDMPRSMWPYRDWVINAINRDMPFDEFTIDQLAGDLIDNANDTSSRPPDAALARQIATGFHRNTMINQEGGIDPEEYRCHAVVDRVNTTATVWLGSTIACAQCHNHKFDPFSQKEYYQLFAFFNSTADETRRDAVNDLVDISPRLELPRPDEAALAGEVARLTALLEGDSPELTAAQDRWESDSLPAATWTPLAICNAISDGGATMQCGEDGLVSVSGISPQSDIYTIIAVTGLQRITGIKLEALPGSPGPGRAPHGNFVLSEFSALAADYDGDETAIPVEWNPPTADYSQSYDDREFDIRHAIDGDLSTGWAIGRQEGRAHAAVFPLREPVQFSSGMLLQLTMAQHYGYQHTLGRFRLSATSDSTGISTAAYPADVQAALRTPRDQRDAKSAATLRRYFRDTAPQLGQTRRALAAAVRAQRDRPTTLIMRELATPRQTFVHRRGNFLDRGDPVIPATPAVLHPWNPDWPRNRLGLARWLVDKQNPLTARVTVNRLWESYFGQGLVSTGEDFGTRADPPTHPQLLDWLALEFMQRKWSMKAMHRLIVLSATYQQSSTVSEVDFPRDTPRPPLPQLYNRFCRQRLDAESLRDQALSIAGLLSDKMGGPSVYPYQPPGLWLNPYIGDSLKWIRSEGVDSNRRGVYTFWRRSMPYPSFASFDAPNREVTCTRRPSTNTSLQALTLLNDPEYLRAAAGLAHRILREGGPDQPARARFAFRACLVRTPTPAEVDRLLALFDSQHKLFTADPARAAALTALTPPPSPPTAATPSTPADLAAWTIVSNVLLNLDETLTRE